MLSKLDRGSHMRQRFRLLVADAENIYFRCNPRFPGLLRERPIPLSVLVSPSPRRAVRSVLRRRRPPCRQSVSPYHSPRRPTGPSRCRSRCAHSPGRTRGRPAARWPSTGEQNGRGECRDSVTRLGGGGGSGSLVSRVWMLCRDVWCWKSECLFKTGFVRQK